MRIDWNFDLKSFEAQESTVDKTYLIHESAKTITARISLNIEATVVSDKEIEKVEAWFQNGNIYEVGRIDRK